MTFIISARTSEMLSTYPHICSQRIADSLLTMLSREILDELKSGIQIGLSTACWYLVEASIQA